MARVAERPDTTTAFADLREYVERLEARGELRRLLEAEGWSVAEAGNGEEALRRMAEATPRVVLLDLQAPEPGGLAFLRDMRRRPEWRAVPMVALADRELPPAERERLQGQVRRIVQTEDGVPEDLVAELRRIASARPGSSVPPPRPAGAGGGRGIA